MKIAVVGCGAVGCYYGARLLQMGNETHFLLRSDYEVVKRDGVFFESINGDFCVHPKVAKYPEEIGVCDAVFIALKTTANSEFSRLISPLVDDHTLIVTLQNGLGNEELLAGLFGEKNILGGLCFVCLNRIQPGYIRHLLHGRIVLGEFNKPAQKRTYEIAKMFESSGIGSLVAESLGKARWEKLVWNIPYNGIGVAGCAGYDTVISGECVDLEHLGTCLSTDKIHGEKRWEGLLIELMNEVIDAANAEGFAVSRDFINQCIGNTKGKSDYWASTLLDFKNRKKMELYSMFQLPLQRGLKAGAKMPRLEKMCKVLEELNTLCK